MGKLKTKTRRNIRKKRTRKQKGGMIFAFVGGVMYTTLGYIGNIAIGTAILKKLVSMKRGSKFENRPNLINAVYCHGILLPGDETVIPKGINLITMVKHGNYSFHSDRIGKLLFNFLIDIDFDLSKMFNLNYDNLEGTRLYASDYSNEFNQVLLKLNEIIKFSVIPNYKKKKNYEEFKKVKLFDFELRIGGEDSDGNTMKTNNTRLLFNGESMFSNLFNKYGIIEPKNDFHTFLTQKLHDISPTRISGIRHNLFTPEDINEYVNIPPTNKTTTLKDLLNSSKFKEGGGRTILLMCCRNTKHNTGIETIIAREISGPREFLEDREEEEQEENINCNCCQKNIEKIINCNSCEGFYCSEYCLITHSHVGQIKCSMCFEAHDSTMNNECKLCLELFCKKHFNEHIKNITKNFKVLIEYFKKEIESIDVNIPIDINIDDMIYNEEEIMIKSSEIDDDHIETIKTYNLLLSHISCFYGDVGKSNKIIIFLTKKKNELLKLLLQ